MKKILYSISLLVLMSTGSLVQAQENNLTLPNANETQQKKIIGLPVDASVDNNDAEKMSNDAQKNLDQLIGNATQNEVVNTDAKLEIQRQTEIIAAKLELAKKAKELWVTLHGEQEAESQKKVQELQQQVNDLQEQLKSSNAKLATDSEQSGISNNDPLPVVSSILGAGGKVKAKILVPYVGEMDAYQGMQINDSLKVVSISETGVKVSKNGKIYQLAFGNSVPRERQINALNQLNINPANIAAVTNSN